MPWKLFKVELSTKPYEPPRSGCDDDKTTERALRVLNCLVDSEQQKLELLTQEGDKFSVAVSTEYRAYVESYTTGSKWQFDWVNADSSTNKLKPTTTTSSPSPSMPLRQTSSGAKSEGTGSGQLLSRVPTFYRKLPQS
jgi:hypothetical protein